MDITMALSVEPEVVGEYVAISIVAGVYLRLVEKLVDLTGIATVSIICALMVILETVFGVGLVEAAHYHTLMVH